MLGCIPMKYKIVSINMSKKLSQIFKEIGGVEPGEGLKVLILKRIELEKDRKMKRKLFLSYAGFLSSVFGTSYALLVFGRSFLQSEFWSMVSLVFSDLLVVVGNWKTFAYSLLETFPVMNMIAILIPLLALFMSVNFYLSSRSRTRNIHPHGVFKFVV